MCLCSTWNVTGCLLFSTLVSVLSCLSVGRKLSVCGDGGVNACKPLSDRRDGRDSCN